MRDEFNKVRFTNLARGGSIVTGAACTSMRRRISPPEVSYMNYGEVFDTIVSLLVDDYSTSTSMSMVS